MDFKKLFKRNKTPDKVGTEAPQLDIPTEVVNKIYLVFPELEGEPTYELESKLTIGSEVGDIIFDDPDLAPKHCTFTHAQDVVSLMDHGSAGGTFINKKKIAPGRIFILQEKDKLRIGELQVKLIIQEEIVPIEEEVVEVDENIVLDDAVMERMQALASGQLPDLPKSETSESETPPETPVQDEVTADIEVPEDLSTAEEEEEEEESDDLVLNDEEATSCDLGISEGDLSDEDLSEEDSEQEHEDYDLHEDIEEESEKKPGLFARLFKKKKKDNEAYEDIEEQIEEEVEVEVDEKTKKILKASGGKKSKIKAKGIVSEASNTLVRVFGLILEVVIILFSIQFLTPLAEFQNIVSTYPIKIWSTAKDLFNQFGKVHYDTHLKVHIDKVLTEVPAISKGLDELVSFLENNTQVLYGLYLFVIIRVMTPILFGVSLGQGMIALRGLGNVAVKRITGPVREIIGLFTAPFIIFDLPALFSKRTLKEMVSFSHIVTRSTAMTTFLTFMWIIIFLVLYIAMPIIEVGKVPVATPVHIMPIQPVKIRLAEQIKGSELKVQGKIPDGHIVLPLFTVVQKKKKRSIRSSYKILNAESGDFIKVSRIKSISLPSLLKKGLEGNYLANWKYPEILKITHDVSGANKNFKVSENLDIAKISKELGLLIKGSFGLSLEKMHSHIIMHGPFLKGYLKFKKATLEHVGEKITKIEMANIGATPFVIFETQNKKKIITLSFDKRKADLYSFESRNDLTASLNILEKIAFSQTLEKSKTIETMFNVVDQLMDFAKITEDGFQGIYQFLYEKSKDIMITKDKFLISELNKSISSIIQFSDSLENEHKDKFFQNISDMLQAIKDQDMDFFGVSDIKTAKVN